MKLSNMFRGKETKNSEVIFENIKNRIITELNQAQQSIKVAVAWFTDNELLDILLKKQEEGIEVHLLIADKKENTLAYDSIKHFYLSEKTGYAMMHHKFCIIDDKIVLSGSFNWTKTAERSNDENLNILRESETVKNYIEKFDFLINDMKEEETEEPKLQIKNIAHLDNEQDIVTMFDKHFQIHLKHTFSHST